MNWKWEILFRALIQFCVISSSFALYEDQIGKFDWKQEFLGKVQHVQFDNLMSVSSYAYIATDRNALACVRMENGGVHKRKIISENDGLISSLVYSPDGLITVTDKGIARIWDPRLTELKWEVDFSDTAEQGTDFQVLASSTMKQHYTQGNLLVLLSNAGLHKAKISNFSPDGEQITTATFLEGQQVLPDSTHVLLVDSASRQILHLVFNDMQKISVTIHDVIEFEITHHYLLDVSSLKSMDTAVVLESQVMVYTGPEDSSFYAIDLRSGEEVSTAQLSWHDISSPVRKLFINENPDVANHGTTFAVWHGDDEISLMSYEDKNFENIYTKKFSSVLDAQIQKVGFETYLFVTTRIRGAKKSRIHITVVDVKTGIEKPELEIKYTLPDNMGDIEKVYIDMFLRRVSPIGYRALLQSTDESITLVEHPNRALWRRDESLASLKDVVMLDLPLSEVHAGMEVELDINSERDISPTVLEMFAKRVKSQYAQLTSWTSQTWKDLNSTPSQKRSSRNQVTGLTRDPFSFHKMLVGVSKSGTLFGLDSYSGSIVWRHYHQELKERNVRLFVQRTTAHFPYPPQVTVIGTAPSKSPVLLEFNPITGVFTDKSDAYKDMDSPLIQAFLLPATTDDSHLRPLVMVSQDLGVRLSPASTPSQLVSRHKIFLYDVNQESGVVQGFKITGSGKAEFVWNLAIPKSHRIVACAGKHQMEKIDSMGRPLANRSVIFKYLNPNVGAIISESTEQNVDHSSLMLHVFDGVTGRIIHSQIHPRCGGPVQIVNSENWIIYSYRHLKYRRNELMSLEFYEGEQQVNGTMFSSFQTRPLPQVVQQAYIFPAHVSALGVTRTERGITSRQILFGFRNGVVFGMIRRFFDPRRPLNMQDQHREEGLVPYMPEIPIAHELMLSYNHTIEQISNIYTSPAALESTSLIFVTGLDLFFTRSQPSKMFDVLKDDFDHGLIAGVLFGMLITVFVVRRLAQVKKLNKAWR